MSTTSYKFSNFLGKIRNFYEFKKKNEKNSYQIQSILKKYEIITIDVYYSVENNSVNQSYNITLNLKNQQTMVIGLKFSLV